VDAVGKGGDFTSIPGGMVILKGRELVFFDGTQEKDLYTIQNALAGNAIEARGIKDVFVAMFDGVAQYNGNDLQYLFQFSNPNIRIDFIKAFPNCIFVNVFDYQKKQI
jgi:hypothetical protein